MSKRVEITIGTDGTVQVEAHGYAGRGCKEATADLEKALGITERDTAKPELYQQQTQTGRTQRA